MAEDPDLPLALLLLRASRWFDRRVIAGLAERGWPRLTPAQTLAFAHLETDEGIRPAELARRLGTARQSTADLVAGLARMGLVETRPDATRPRGRLVHLTPDGHAVAADARDILARDEAALPASATARLREALTTLGLDDTRS